MREHRKIARRYNWLINLVHTYDFRLGAEIGCSTGNTSFRLLKRCPQLKLYCVDTWSKDGGVQYQDWDFKNVKEKFDIRIQPFLERVTILQGLSHEMVKKVKNNSLDFIFIDADHTYEGVVKDIQIWTPKLKAGGMITGHDWNGPGVRLAIDQLIPTWKDAEIDHVWYARKEDVLL